MKIMKQALHLHLVSDATGETIHAVARACLAQFEQTDVVEHYWNLIRTEKQLDIVFQGIAAHPGFVMFTLVNPELRRALQNFCRNLPCPCVPVLDPLLNALSAHLGQPAASLPGRQHVLDAEYFARIAAMDYAMAADDGQGLLVNGSALDEAEVILLGVSRTSKTPTCLYLANRGIRAANIPLVPGQSLATEFEQALLRPLKPLVVGLTKDPEKLLEIRETRLRQLSGDKSSDYVDPLKVREEVQEARRLFVRRGWPVIDVTRRSIEETSAEIISLLTQHRHSIAAKSSSK